MSQIRLVRPNREEKRGGFQFKTRRISIQNKADFNSKQGGFQFKTRRISIQNKAAFNSKQGGFLDCLPETA